MLILSTMKAISVEREQGKITEDGPLLFSAHPTHNIYAIILVGCGLAIPAISAVRRFGGRDQHASVIGSLTLATKRFSRIYQLDYRGDR